MRVFLGGTCNESDWRDQLILKLEVEYFNPVVEDWTPECMEEELNQRRDCDLCLYVITPKMTGVYSIAEVVDDSNKRPEKTLFCVLNRDGRCTFSDAQLKSLGAVSSLISNNGAHTFNNLTAVADFINGKAELCSQ